MSTLPCFDRTRWPRVPVRLTQTCGCQTFETYWRRDRLRPTTRATEASSSRRNHQKRFMIRHWTACTPTLPTETPREPQLYHRLGTVGPAVVNPALLLSTSGIVPDKSLGATRSCELHETVGTAPLVDVPRDRLLKLSLSGMPDEMPIIDAVFHSPSRWTQYPQRCRLGYLHVGVVLCPAATISLIDKSGIGTRKVMLVG